MGAELAVDGVDLGALALVDEAGVEEELTEVGDGDVARLARGGRGGGGHGRTNIDSTPSLPAKTLSNTRLPGKTATPDDPRPRSAAARRTRGARRRARRQR